MRTRITRSALAMAVLMIASASAPPIPTATGRPPSQDDDDEERAFELAMGRMTFEGNCLICHSAEMVQGQRLTAEQWAAEVEKMIGWGAPVPDEERDRLVAYLVASFSTEAESPEFARMPLQEASAPTRPEPDGDVLPPGDPSQGAAVHAEHCATCHGQNGQGGDLGPNMVARPILYRPKEYAKVLRDGRHRMPGFSAVLTPQQIADTLAWLRSRSE